MFWNVILQICRAYGAEKFAFAPFLSLHLGVSVAKIILRQLLTGG
jgi:hypothetical protein